MEGKLLCLSENIVRVIKRNFVSVVGTSAYRYGKIPLLDGIVKAITNRNSSLKINITLTQFYFPGMNIACDDYAHKLLFT